jgi:hypothetical protein
VYGDIRIPVTSRGWAYMMPGWNPRATAGGYRAILSGESDSVLYYYQPSDSDAREFPPALASGGKDNTIWIEWQNAPFVNEEMKRYPSLLSGILAGRFLVKVEGIEYLLSVLVLLLGAIIAFYTRPPAASVWILLLGISTYIGGFWLFWHQHVLLRLPCGGICVCSDCISAGDFVRQESLITPPGILRLDVASDARGTPPFFYTLLKEDR